MPGLYWYLPIFFSLYKSYLIRVGCGVFHARAIFSIEPQMVSPFSLISFRKGGNKKWMIENVYTWGRITYNIQNQLWNNFLSNFPLNLIHFYYLIEKNQLSGFLIWWIIGNNFQQQNNIINTYGKIWTYTVLLFISVTKNRYKCSDNLVGISCPAVPIYHWYIHQKWENWKI